MSTITVPSEIPCFERNGGAMAELKHEGKIRHIGVSNFTVEWLDKAAGATGEPLFCNQIEYHPYIEQGPPMKACHDRGIGVVAYSPLAADELSTMIGWRRSEGSTGSHRHKWLCGGW